jgi:hypothetical protein|tara:strand:+ start:388 stop:867 length:480 start_codon:yes stop_codon:yes gene_type:complete
MASSKFSSPFFQKSPLYGAYSSGADAMVTVSDAPHYEKLQNDILGATLAALPTEEEKGEAQVKKADRRDARVKAGGSKVKQFLDKNKLGFLTSNKYKKDADGDLSTVDKGNEKYQTKTAKIRESGNAKITNAQKNKNAKSKCTNGVDRVTSAGTVICNK